MNIDPELPIEPLPDAAWKRIEQRVFESLRAAPSGPATRLRENLRWRWVATAAGLSIVALAIALISWSTPAGFDSGRYVAESHGRELSLDGVNVRLEPHSTLTRARKAGKGAEWFLVRGAATFQVSPRAASDPLAVWAGDVRVEVVGTVFRVARSGTSATVETHEGKVRVRCAGKTVLVVQGERWPVAGPARSQASIAPAPPSSASAESIGGRTRSAGLRASDHADQRRRYEAAATLEKRDAGEARRAYEALAKEAGPWAGNALFALGRLEAEQQWTAAAERDLRRYLERYPNGANASDARALLALLRTGWAAQHGP